MKYFLWGLLALVIILLQRTDGFWSCIHVMDPKRPVVASADHRPNYKVPVLAVKNEPGWSNVVLQRSAVKATPLLTSRSKSERTGRTGVFVSSTMRMV